MQPARTPGDIVDHRYRILQELGRRVALKELSLKGLKDWKQVELFEREAHTLESLDHPAIPAYVDYFQVDTADNRLFYLAQEIAAGTSLADLVESGWRGDEAEARRLAGAVLQGVTTHKLGTPLTSVAKAWLVNELDSFIKHLPQRSEGLL